MDPMQKISVHYSNLTKAERTTCDLILNNPQIIINNSIAEAAELYKVSPSSILRLAKKINYKGYSEFRYALEQYQKRSNQTSHDSMILNVVETIKISLDELINRIDENEIIKLVDLIKNKKTITIGIGNSAFPAKQLTYILYPYDKWTDCIEESIRMSYLERVVNDNHLIIIFSVSGNSGVYVPLCKVWKKNKTKIVLITSNPETKTSKYVDHTFILPSLPFANIEDDGEKKFLDNRSVFFFFVDIIMSYYVSVFTRE